MQNTTRTDWGRRQPPIGGSNFELYAWFFMRVSGLSVSYTHLRAHETG